MKLKWSFPFVDGHGTVESPEETMASVTLEGSISWIVRQIPQRLLVLSNRNTWDHSRCSVIIVTPDQTVAMGLQFGFSFLLASATSLILRVIILSVRKQSDAGSFESPYSYTVGQDTLDLQSALPGSIFPVLVRKSDDC
jgi:hypothetical protein